MKKLQAAAGKIDELKKKQKELLKKMNAQGLEEEYLCPISHEIMRDPVV